VPIYEYKCPNGHLFEVFHSMSAEGPAVCEVCGEGPLVRVLHPVAVHYKGSGFYSTDYGKGSKKKDGGSSSSSSDSGSSGGSDSGSSSSSGSDSGSSSAPKAAEA
jgi:putative FmdB family regulatory protein